MTPLALALVLLAASDVSGGRAVRAIKHSKISRKVELPLGCLYGGRWHGEGAVRAAACLSCVCVRGALSCRRQACAPPPDPPPGCRLEHAPGACCPELHCPDGVIKLDQGASARLDDFTPETMGQGVVLPACVEGGTVYAAGSAMPAGAACEQCFCLGGARRCVRPRCLPPPPGCRAPPAPGACCPQRYYCHHVDATPPHSQNPHDCQTEDGEWVREGERVRALSSDKCTQCFCLGGKILCQSQSCAPKLKGCTPLVLPGQCCPHKYICNDRGNNTISNLSNHDNLLVPLNENRSFHTSKSAKRETTVKAASSNANKKQTSPTTSTKVSTTAKSTAIANQTTTAKPTTKNKNATTIRPTTMKKNLVTKTENVTKSSTTNTQTSSATNKDGKTNITTTPVPKVKKEVTTKPSTTVAEENITLESSTESTEQPERTIKIIINGTVNCTTELSSSTLVLNTTNSNDSVWINTETHPRIPMFNEEIEAHTSLPNEIITNRVYNEDFDDTESFTINVTSSLRTNTSSHALSTTSTTTTPRPKTVSPMLVDGANASKSKKDEMDFDYNDPTLPPSLPNLKIIPFVAADAVVDDDETLPKENVPFTSDAQDEKYPVYYPGLETKEHEYPIRREDDYNANQYPIFVSKKEDNKSYPSLSSFDNFSANNDNITDVILSGIQKFMPDTTSRNIVEIKTPEPNIDNSRISGSSLFSPPAETEGGFIPKGPGAIDEFYSIYPSTPASPAMAHLTTSMQIDTKEDCVSSAGQRISDGASIEMGCSLCICAWSELHCSPRTCHTPPGCRWRTASIHSHDLCCGELICDYDNKYPAVTTDSNKPIREPPKEPSKNDANDFIKDETNVMPLNNTLNTLEKKIENNDKGNKELNSANNTRPSVSTQQTPLSTAKVQENTTKPPMFTEPSSNTGSSQSLEYEEEEDDDEGFSLGSVLKLLLSESYNTKTTASTSPPTKKTTPRAMEQTFRPTVPSVETTPKDFYDTHNEFIPMPPSIVPFKKIPVPNPITRIDHLLLGESNSIRDPRPPTTSKPTPTTRRYTVKTTQPPYTSKPTTKEEIATEPTRQENDVHDVQSVEAGPPQPFALGLPKLAGCNIYGQMYRVGRIITELSTPCQECRCTEFGVHCTALGC